MVAILLGLHFLSGLLGRDSLLAALLTIVEFVGAGLTVFMGYSAFTNVRNDAETRAQFQKLDAQIARSIGSYHADAYKLLRYYQLWRQDVARRADAGYMIEGLHGENMLPRCLEDMDAVITELQSVVNRTASLT